jgi:hypothetical protein
VVKKTLSLISCTTADTRRGHGDKNEDWFGPGIENKTQRKTDMVSKASRCGVNGKKEKWTEDKDERQRIERHLNYGASPEPLMIAN